MRWRSWRGTLVRSCGQYGWMDDWGFVGRDVVYEFARIFLGLFEGIGTKHGKVYMNGLEVEMDWRCKIKILTGMPESV